MRLNSDNREENSKIYNFIKYVHNYFFYLISETLLRNHALKQPQKPRPPPPHTSPKTLKTGQNR